MVQKKMIDVNRINSILQKTEDLISFYEKQSKTMYDAVSASFLRNVADKKRIQLAILERMLRSQGMEVIPRYGNESSETVFCGPKLFERSLEDIFNFISKQSLNELRSLSFFSLEIHQAKPLFNAMFELEEDFLVFVEYDYLDHLVQSTAPAISQHPQSEKAMLASAG
jgi:hypothetical protein